ncbi:MAG: ABC transporter permease [Gammaproteobacteria bacterium]|nr:ABC transporter permease [Gammaproteobacteria bacterium]
MDKNVVNKNLSQEWTTEIKPKRGFLEIPVQEIWAYRDLLFLLVRRDFVAMYKQTILGPLWFVIQPVLTTLVFTLVFGNIANISTDGLPHILFYLAGITCWNYFAETLTKTSETFTQNAGVFGKVYFPRIIVPLSVVVSNLIKLTIQFILFLGFTAYYWVSTDLINPNITVLLFPLLVLLMGGIALSMGMIISSLTTKYRDLRFLLAFAVQLLMYATPVIYPLSTLPETYKSAIMLNPITPIVETFRYSFLGQGSFDVGHLLYSVVFMLITFFIALIVFNQIEKNFMDTV